jgi:putative endonuclease
MADAPALGAGGATRGGSTPPPPTWRGGLPATPQVLSRGVWMVILYVLRSLVNGKRYVGLTNDLGRRLAEHRRRNSRAGQQLGEFNLLYSEEFDNYEEARRCEKYLKSGHGRAWLDRLDKEWGPPSAPRVPMAGKATPPRCGGLPATLLVQEGLRARREAPLARSTPPPPRSRGGLPATPQVQEGLRARRFASLARSSPPRLGYSLTSERTVRA